MADSPETKEEFYPDGTLHVRRQLRAGEPHGLFESFHPNGMPAERGLYEDGKRVGTWEFWDDTGRKLFTGPADEETAAAPAPEPDPAAWDEEIKLEESPESRKRAARMLEIGVVLCLAWLAHAWFGLSAPELFWPDETAGEILVDDGLAFLDLGDRLIMGIQVLIPLLWIIWRTDIRWSEVGIVRVKWARDIGLGLGLALVILGVDLALIMLLDLPFLNRMYLPAHPFMIAFMAGVVIVNSLAEEIVWRGYMLHRLRQVFGSVVPAVLVSSVLFGVYHVYQGLGGGVLATLFGILMCVSVLVWRSIWPAVIAHTAFNIYVNLHFAWWP